MMAGVDMVHVPYRGAAPAMTDLIAGQVQVIFIATPGSIEYIRAGKLRALAVTTATRAEALPDIPTVAEFVPGYEASAWFGIGAPRTRPPRSSTGSTGRSMRPSPTPTMKARLADWVARCFPGSPADFGRLIAEETEKWAKVVKFSGAQSKLTCPARCRLFAHHDGTTSSRSTVANGVFRTSVDHWRTRRICSV